MKGIFLAGMAAFTLAGCSTVMEAQRPDPIDLNQFTVGERRVDVMAKLGVPKTTIPDGGRSCDVYQEYTSGVSKVGKAGIIFTEAAADFLTLGLTEVVATPAEAVTKNKLHTVFMCYGPDGTLATVADQGRVVIGVPATPTPTPASGPAVPPAPTAANTPPQ